MTTTTQHARGTSRFRRSAQMIAAVALAAAAALVAPSTALAAGPSGVTPETTTVRFDSTAGTDWAPPKGVTSISVRMVGGSGAEITHEGISTGAGRAGLLEFDLAVTDGDRFRMFSATRGGISKTHNGGAGYLNGGAGGANAGAGSYGGGGGGAAAILRNDTVIAVAGGGGGVGGAVKGSSTISKPNPWGYGGAGGWGTSGDDVPGEKGTSGDHPGNGGSAGAVTGKSGTAGSSAASFTNSAGGGGGGGGWPSGNGGQSGKKAFSSSTGGGGAGGTSYITGDATRARLLTQMDSDGFVEVTYTNPVRLQLTASSPFVAGVQQIVAATVFGENGVIPRNGKVILTEGNTFIGYDQIRDGGVDFWFALPEGARTLKAEFTSFDRTQHAVALLDVNVLPGPEHTVTAFRSASQSALPGGTFSLSGYVHSDTGLDLSGERVTIMVDGNPNVVQLRADGGFGGEFTAPTDLGPFEVKAVFAGGSAFAPSESAPLTINVHQYAATVQLQPSATEMAFGEPFGASVSVTGSYGSPTGSVHLSDGTTIVGTAELGANRTAQFENLVLPVGVTELTAIYDGNGSYGAANSATQTITVTPATTTTTLAVASHSGYAGEPAQLEVEVAVNDVSVVDPQGTVRIMHNDDTVAELAPGDDSDVTPRNGVVRFQTELHDLAAGQHQFVAVFVPGDGFVGSSSDPVSLELNSRATTVSVEPEMPSVFEQASAVLSVSVAALDDAESRTAPRSSSGALPPLEGTVFASINDALVGAPVVLDSATGAAELRLPGLPVGVHAVTVTFHADSVAYASSSDQFDLTVVAATGGMPEDEGASDPNSASPAGQPAKSGTEQLLMTGGPESPLAVVALGAVVAVLAGGVLLWRRRVKR